MSHGGFRLDPRALFSPFTSTPGGFLGEVNPLSKLTVVVSSTILSAFISDLTLLIVMGVIFTALIALSGSLRLAAPFLSFILLFWLASVAIIMVLSGDPFHAPGFLSLFFARFFIISGAGLFFAFTTEPQKLAESLRSIRIPGEIVFTLTVALRYIPALAVEASSIWDSLKLRASLSGRSIIRRPSLLYRGFIIPLIIRTVKISDEVAIAAETRGFNPAVGSGGGVGLTWRDPTFLACFMVLFASLMILDWVVI